jgi:hypothetical protein
MAEQVVDGQSMTGLLIKQAPGSKCEWLLSRLLVKILAGVRCLYQPKSLAKIFTGILLPKK